MASPYLHQRDLKMDEPPKSGSSFCRHLCIWFFFHGDSWSGTASELLSELKVGVVTGLVTYESWPETPDDVCAYLERHAEELRLAGVEAHCQNREAALRLIKISWVDGIRRYPSETMEAAEMSKTLETSSAAVDENLDTKSSDPAHANPELNKYSPHDEWELFRKLATFKPDQQKGRMLRIALLTLIVALALAIIFLGSHYWKAASVSRPDSSPRAIASLNVGSRPMQGRSEPE